MIMVIALKLAPKLHSHMTAIAPSYAAIATLGMKGIYTFHPKQYTRFALSSSPILAAISTKCSISDAVLPDRLDQMLLGFWD